MAYECRAKTFEDGKITSGTNYGRGENLDMDSENFQGKWLTDRMNFKGLDKSLDIFWGHG